MLFNKVRISFNTQMVEFFKLFTVSREWHNRKIIGGDLKKIKNRVWKKISALIFLFNTNKDFLLYKKSFRLYRKLQHKQSLAKGSLLICSGRGMNVIMAQIWCLYGFAMQLWGYKIIVLTTRSQKTFNRYFQLINAKFLYYDEMIVGVNYQMPETISKKIKETTSFNVYRNLFFKNAPIGQIAMSTYSRHNGTGIVDVSDANTQNIINTWCTLICQAYTVAENIFKSHDIKMLFFTEVFMEEYGGFYYAALKEKLNIIRFAGTVRDNAIILQHLNVENDRIHHSSLSKSSWEKIKKTPINKSCNDELNQNFIDRYGNKWMRSKRNHARTQIISVNEARQQLGLTQHRKVAIVFSHILYDTLFFFGTDLFKDYSEWLVETVRAACENDAVDWFVKVHPSNIWRGEFDSLLKGKYEEERIIEKTIGSLPRHVRIIRADTCINPYVWFQLADYGITVRGTSGLEMAAMGKAVVTAGTGRYEGNGFTMDPNTKEEYLEIIKNIQVLPPLSAFGHELAKRYAHSIFIRKPFTMHSLTARLRDGKKEMKASDDLLQICTPLQSPSIPEDLIRFAEWAEKPSDQDLLSD